MIRALLRRRGLKKPQTDEISFASPLSHSVEHPSGFDVNAAIFSLGFIPVQCLSAEKHKFTQGLTVQRKQHSLAHIISLCSSQSDIVGPTNWFEYRGLAVAWKQTSILSIPNEF